jgi:hypothetical protein
VEVEAISTSTSKKFLLGILILSCFSGVSAQFYYDDGGGNQILESRDSYFIMPEYDSHREILTEFVAPFVFVAIILQFGFSRALNLIMAGGRDDPWEQDNLWNVPFGIPLRERHGMDHVSPDARKYATVMSLAVTASLVPTPFFQNIQAAIALVFGGTIYLLFAGVGIVVLYGIIRILL